MAKINIIKRIFSRTASGEGFNNNSIKYSFQVKILIIITTIALTSILFTYHFDTSILRSNQHSFLVGSPWQNQTLKADITYPLFKDKESYNQAVFDAEANALPVYSFNPDVYNDALKEINSVITNFPSVDANSKYIGNYNVNSRLLMMFLESNEKIRKEQIQKMSILFPNFIKKLYSNGYINESLDKITTSEIIAEISNNQRNILKKKFLTSTDNVEDKIVSFIKSNFTSNSEPLLIDILKNTIKPNLYFNKEQTENEKILAKKNVPQFDGYVKAGEIIVEKGQIITREIKQRIDSYKEAKKLRSENYLTPNYVFGNIGQAIIIFSILIIYLSVLRKKIFEDNVQLLIFFSSLLSIVFFSWLSVEIPSSYPLGYLVPIPAITMLVAIVFDSRTAFYATVTSSLLLAATRGSDMNTAISFIFAGVMAAFTVRDIQSRTQMFRSIFFILLGLVVSILFFDLQSSVDLSYSATKILLATINASLSPILTFGLLFIIEHTTSITTDLRIQEFDNINHPLLKKMSEIAMGTYQHTMNVAMLAERCAIEIGANPLLTRVGAYFHDIGKIAKPEYFTENQKDMTNKLELLPPKKAAEVIKKHVIDGIELGKEYKIPQRILDFIPMHHGTSLIKHFYAKALEEAADKNEVKEIDFRYPGPKPRSKEAAILMICDSSEAISKVENLSREEIQKMIRNNILDKFLDFQFSETFLTLKDIAIIEDTILKNLLGTHSRTKYKEIPDTK
ncbi:MAG: HD family phosphohydrolase [Candidatus Kapaibacteriota bacterium]